MTIDQDGNRGPANSRSPRARWFRGAGLVLAASLVGMGAPAVAQTKGDTAARNAVDLGEVTVTARRVEENIQSVPLAVTALSQTKLDTLVVDNIADLNKLSPGLQVNACVSGGLTGGAACRTTIRGFTSGQNADFGAVASYFADAPGMFTSNYDLQNIQVLKGPQGTLFGDTVTGGAVLYVPRKPNGAKGGFLTAELGNFNYRKITGAYENSLADGKILFRVAGQYRHRDGFATVHYSNGTTDKVGDYDQEYMRASLVLKPFDRLENYTVALLQRDASHGGVQPALYTDPRFFSAAIRNVIPSADPVRAATYQFYTGALPAAGLSWSQIALAAVARQAAAGPDEVWSDINAKTTRLYAGIVNQTKVTLTDHLYVRNIYQLRWIPYQKGGSGNYDGTDEPALQQSGYRSPTSTNGYDGNYGTSKNGFKNRQWTDEVQAVGDLWDNKIQYQGGYFHREDRPGDRIGYYPYATPSPGAGGVILSGNNSSFLTPAACAALGTPGNSFCVRLSGFARHSDAVYAQVNYKLTDSLTITGGVRRSVISPGVTTTGLYAAPSISFTASNGTTIVVPVMNPSLVKYSNIPDTTSSAPGYKSTTYNISADWKINDDNLVYIAHRKGFKGGGVNAALPVTDPNYVFQPESLKDVEIGLKSDWSIGGVRGRTNVAFYKDWYSNIQTGTRGSGNAQLFTINGGTADFHGVELEASIIPSPWFTISGNISYESNKYTQFIENTFCSVQAWRQAPGGNCDLAAGIPANTPITIDHANGVLTIAAVAPSAALPAGRAAQVFNFKPDGFNVPLTWSLQPEIHLEPLLGEDVTIEMNIYHSAGKTGYGVGPSDYAGVSPFVVQSWTGAISGLDAFSYPKYTSYDLSIDWRKIKGTQANAFLRITNLQNKRRRVGGGDTFVSGGSSGPIANEPRMVLAGLTYNF